MIHRPGWRTTELGVLVVCLAGMLLVPTVALPLAILGGCYCLARGVAKIGKARFASLDEMRSLLTKHEGDERYRKDVETRATYEAACAQAAREAARAAAEAAIK